MYLVHPVIRSSDHLDFMQRALALSRAHLGQTWPNPCVGAVVVKNNKIIGEGVTAKGGRPHAEPQALAQAGEDARGATLYVTLEPCSHQGQTPPCTAAIIDAGIVECVIACRDPHASAKGGIARLEAAGIRTTLLDMPEARDMHRGFFSVVEKGRPYIALKIAASADGKIAAQPGIRTDITGATAREHAMKLRADFDAILTGIGTVLADDPQLNVRIPGMEHRSPVRVVLDSSGRLPADAKIHPAWVFGRDENVLEQLTKRGITRLLIEGGAGINSYFLKNKLVDTLYLYESPIIIGPQGLDAVGGGLDLAGWKKTHEALLDKDRLTAYERG